MTRQGSNQSKHWDKIDIISRMAKTISDAVQAGMKEEKAPTGAVVSVEAALILGEILLMDAHRCAGALERIADALEENNEIQKQIAGTMPGAPRT